MKAALPANESERLEALRRYEVLDSVPERDFDDITLLASQICGAPIAAISLIDEQRQWFKSKVGLEATETSRDIAFCAHGILQSDLFIVPDALADDRFSANPLVTGNPKIRFYAGAPLVTPDGQAIGMMCVNDHIPRKLTLEQEEALRALSRQVVAQLELRKSLRDLRSTEKLVRQSQQRLHHLVSANPAVMYSLKVVNGERSLSWMSDNILSVTGHSMEEAFAPNWWLDQIHPGDRDRANREHAKLLVSDRLTLEYRFARKDGTYFWVRDEKALIRDETGEAVEIVGSWADITEHRQAEWQLSTQFAISRVLAESATFKEASLGLLRVICEHLQWDVGELHVVDRAADKIRFEGAWVRPGAGLEPSIQAASKDSFNRGEEWTGRIWESGKPAWVTDLAVEKVTSRVSAAEQLGLHSAFAFPVLAGNEVTAVFKFFGYAIREPDPEIMRVFAILGSQLGQFFERKRLEEQLVQSQKLETVGKLAGGIAHEFNSIMTAIIGQSELIATEATPEGNIAWNAKEIRVAADRAAALTRQLLAYGRKQMLKPEVLDLNTILRGMENVLPHLLGPDINLRVVPGRDPRAVRADAGQIEQVIVNMAINARDAMPTGGRLTLETSNEMVDDDEAGRHPELKPGGYVLLAIADNGAGMSEEVKKRVFEPFFTTKQAGKGTGLGLATCYGIIKQSGGHITLDSEPRKGTTFKIYLPQAASGGKRAEQKMVSADLPRGRETLLLVEEDPSLREMAGMLLKRLGYRVLAAPNGANGLVLLQEHGKERVDLLFADMAMQQFGGRELSERVRAQHPETRVLYASAYAENAAGQEGHLRPGESILQKPFTPSALALKVREVLDA